ncbi:MAG: phosphoglycolate phosphatase, partial [Candidatus Methanomethylicota archaeon]
VIRALEDSGIKVILASGNALCVVKALSRYIGCSGAVIAENGGVVEYKGVVKFLGDFNKAKAALEAVKAKYGQVSESWSNRYRHVDLVIGRNLDLSELRSFLAQAAPGVKVIDSGFAYHLVDENVNKGKGLMRALSMMGIKPQEVLAIGDSEVDVEMLEVARLGAVVANADEKAKAVADYVASKSFGEGFVEIVEKCVLKSCYPYSRW